MWEPWMTRVALLVVGLLWGGLLGYGLRVLVDDARHQRTVRDRLARRWTAGRGAR